MSTFSHGEGELEEVTLKGPINSMLASLPICSKAISTRPTQMANVLI